MAEPTDRTRVVARVGEVIDGDTIEAWIDVPVKEPGGRYGIVADPRTVGYIGIYEPEGGHPRGDAATEADRQLLQSAIAYPKDDVSETSGHPDPPELNVYLQKDVSETDDHGRLLRYVFLQDGRCVNEELVRQGHAKAVSSPPDTRLDSVFLVAQYGAQGAGAGQCAPTPTPTPVVLKGVPAQVVKVVDGDTIEVEMDIGQPFEVEDGNPTPVAKLVVSYTVRHIGIDAPERGGPHGDAAAEANRHLVEGQLVYLEKDVSNTDNRGRLLRYVYLEDGRCVNEELVRRGHAVVVSYPPDTRLDDFFLAAQYEAQATGVGRWAVPPPEEHN